MQLLGECDDGLGDLAVGAVLRAAADERLVDFHRTRRHLAQVAEARVARAEVVDREFEAFLFELAQQAQRDFRMPRRGRLGDLETDARRFDAMEDGRFVDAVGECGIAQFLW